MEMSTNSNLIFPHFTGCLYREVWINTATTLLLIYRFCNYQKK